MNVPMYGPVTTADRLDRLLDQQGEAVSRFMREAATDAIYHLRAQHRKLLESEPAREWTDPSEYERRGPIYDALVRNTTDEAKIDALITLLKELGLYDIAETAYKKLRALPPPPAADK